MHKKSNTYSSSAPLKSGPNMTGYYMGESPNLMTMMQTGGDAAIQRALQQREEIDAIESAQRDEAKRQGRGRLFGSIGGIAGGLLGAALAPATGGLSLAVPVAIGTILGKGAGESLGAGRAKRSDRPEGTFFYGDTFSDIDEASREFNQGILGRAGMAGLQAGLTAGLMPSGGIYGTARAKAGGLRSSLADLAGFGGAPLPVAPSVDLNAVSLPSTGARIFDPSSVFPASTYNPMASPADTLLGASDYIPETFSLTQAVPVPQFYEDGGLIEYQNGGLTEKLFDDYSNFTLPSNETQSGDPTTGSGFASTSPIMSTMTNPASFTSADIDVKKIAAEMGLEISDADAAKYYEEYDLSEIAPVFDAQRMAIGNIGSDIRNLGAQTGFTASGFGGNLLSSAQESARQTIGKARVASVEDFRDRIKRQLAADIASGVSGIRRIDDSVDFNPETFAATYGITGT
jgi:hypothetical protein